MIDTFAIREKIINLALNGQLSKQKPEETIKFERKPMKKWETIFQEEIFFEIPSNWTFARIGEISKINPKNTIEDSEEVSFIPMACVKEGFSDYHTYEVKKWSDIKKGFNHFAEGDIGVAKITPCFQNRKSVIYRDLHNGYGAGTTELVTVRVDSNIILAKYLLYYFQSDVFIKNGVESFTGVVGQQRIHKDYLKTCVVPIPPIEEQERIINIVESTFEKLDTIDYLQSAYSSDLEVLKSKIIDAGIQGKLTEQLPEDGNAEDLYAAIQDEKNKLIKEKKIKKSKALPEITEDEIPFEIPENWKWVRLNDIGIWGSGATPSRRRNDYYNGSIPWVKTGELNNGYIDDTEEHITELAYKESSVKLNPIGSVLIAMYGATIGKVAILNTEATTNQACCACNAYKGIYNKFLFYYLMSHKAEFISRSHGGAQPNISKEIILKEAFPLPPLDEQFRIVEKIEAILSTI